MQKFRSWRNLLGSVIDNGRKRQRLAEVLNVNPTTLTRWATGKSHPRHDNLHSLVEALPQRRSELLHLIELEYPNFTMNLCGKSQLEGIPAEFYAHVINAYSSSPAALRAVTICSLIIQQILGQLDPQQKGLAVVVSRCVPPRQKGQKVRSMYLTAGHGTPPWPGDLAYRPIFFGAESQMGRALTTGHHITVNTPEMRTQSYPQHQTELEKSTVVYPILQSDRTPGCLGAGSTEANFFSQERLDTLQAYAYLMVLAFEQEEFYDLADIDLGMMPPMAVQLEQLTHFRQRVDERVMQSAHEGRSLKRPEVERSVLQDLETELLKLTFSR